MKHQLKIAGMVALVGLLLAPEAGAQGRGRGRGGRGPGFDGLGFGPRMAASLNLTAAQQEQIQTLRAEMQQEVAGIRAELQQKRTEMRPLWTAERPDEQAILAKHAEMDTLRQQLRAQRVTFRLAVIELLTPEQRTQLNERAGRGGPGGGRGYGPGWSNGDCPNWGLGNGQGRGLGQGQGRGRRINR